MEEKNVKISVIVPLYNNMHYIERCVDSILKQNYDSYEVIIIDDGSVDDSLKVVKQKYEHNEKIKIFSQKNSGVSSARNKGLNIAVGEWITFVDSDDWIENNMFETFIQIVDKNNYDMIISNMFCNRESEQQVLYNMESKEILDKNKFFNSIICLDYGKKIYREVYGNCRHLGGKFYKNSIIKNNKIHFFEDLITFEDGVFNLYYSYFAKSIYMDNKPYYHYYFNSTSVTKNYKWNILEDTYNIYNHILDFSKFANEYFNSINYFCIDSFTLIINTILFFESDKEKCIKLLKNEYERYKSIWLKEDIKYKYLLTKNKLVYFLLKHKKINIIYYIYKIKRLIKGKRD